MFPTVHKISSHLTKVTSLDAESDLLKPAFRVTVIIDLTKLAPYTGFFRRSRPLQGIQRSPGTTDHPASVPALCDEPDAARDDKKG